MDKSGAVRSRRLLGRMGHRLLPIIRRCVPSPTILWHSGLNKTIHSFHLEGVENARVNDTIHYLTLRLLAR
jgi:hypothetical protein